MEEYVSSKAMITPGVAGSATTTLTATLVSTFGLPGAETALVFSFLFGFMVFADKTVGIYYRIVLYIISSMTIFSVAVGLNQSGIAITQSEQTKMVQERELKPDDIYSKAFFQNWL